MKDICKYLLILLLLFKGIDISAQEDSPFQFGIKAGGNLFCTTTNLTDIADKKIKIGYEAGLTAEYAFSDNFYLQSGISFITKGAVLKGKEGTSTDENHWTQTINLQYLQIPVLPTYKFELVSDTEVFFSLGPYIAYGIGGKSTRKNTYVNSDRKTEKEKMDSFGKNSLKDVDLGLKFCAGIELDKYIFAWSYEFGLLNLEQKNNELNSLFNTKHYRNRGLSISAGYKF